MLESRSAVVVRESDGIRRFVAALQVDFAAHNRHYSLARRRGITLKKGHESLELDEP